MGCIGQVQGFVVKLNLSQSIQDFMIFGFHQLIRSTRNSQRLGRESFLIPMHVFNLLSLTSIILSGSF